MRRFGLGLAIWWWCVCPVLGQVVAREGACYLEKVHDQMVLHLQGTYREMGRAQGKLLAQAVRENCEAFLDHWCLGGGREKVENLQRIYRSFEPFVPARYLEELAGLAEGSGVPLQRLQLLHAIPERFHCSGVVAMKSATKDGKVYHTRSLDYALNIGKERYAQQNALLIVYQPDDGQAYCVVGWAGFLGCVTGMNAAGISIGEKGSASRDEDYAGVPMIFLMREALRQGGNLDQALAVFRQGPRTCGYNFIVADGQARDARALEVTRNHYAEFKPGDPAENQGPHYAIADCIRRVNHFVCPECAVTQRGDQDVRGQNPASWVGYDLIGHWLKKEHGRIDDRKLIGLLRNYPPQHPCLHQVVFCPTDRVIWVSHAAAPSQKPAAGAQNQPFYRYDLGALLAGKPATAGLQIDRKEATAAAAEPVTTTIEFRALGDQTKIPEAYRLADHQFPVELQIKNEYPGLGYSVYHVRFPSPVTTRFPENNTVHAEYYRPHGPGPHPATIVLDILGGDQTLGRMQSAYFAQHGIAALFVQMAYYGPRRPAHGKIRLLMPDVDHTLGAVRQTVLDIRRASAFLASRPEVDSERLGVCGTSLGSFMGTLAAEMEPRIRRVAICLGGGGLVDAFYDHPQGAPLRLLYESLGGSKDKLRERVGIADPITCAANLRDRRVLMIGAAYDEIVPPTSTKRLWAALGEPRILWYPAGHYTAAAYIVPAMHAVIEHLQAP